MKHSYWLEFLGDWGDCVGGYLLGVAVMTKSVILGIIDVSVVLAAIFLKNIPKTKLP